MKGIIIRSNETTMFKQYFIYCAHISHLTELFYIYSYIINNFTRFQCTTKYTHKVNRRFKIEIETTKRKIHYEILNLFLRELTCYI